MEPYNFWTDLLDTYQSMGDWVKALWIVVVPGSLLGLVALVLRYRLASRWSGAFGGLAAGDLVYSVHRDGLGRFLVYRHGRAGDGSVDDILSEPAYADDARVGDGFFEDKTRGVRDPHEPIT